MVGRQEITTELFRVEDDLILQIGEIVQRTGMAAMDYTVKKVQSVGPIRETKIQKLFTGPCSSRCCHSIDIPTTMKVSIQNRNQWNRTVTSKPKRAAPTIPRPVQSISNVPTYLQDSFTSLNE